MTDESKEKVTMQEPASTQQHPQHLPPSPPPSPPSTRRRTKHHKNKPSHDPFLHLGAPGTPLFPSSSPHSTPSSPHSSEPEEPEEPLLVRLILTPIYFTSFLLSLFLIDTTNRLYRTRRTANPPSILSYLAPSTWLDPEPYQDPADSTWGDRRKSSVSHFSPPHVISPDQGNGAGGGGGAGAGAGDGDGRAKVKRGHNHWYLHKKIRQVARMEISDAFEMRGRVILGMVVLWMGVVWAGWWVLRVVWAWAS